MKKNNLHTSYFRLSITDKCNLNCYFCHKEGQSKTCNRELIDTEDIIWVSKIVSKIGFTKFKITGGEPTLRKDLPVIVKELKEHGVEDIALITNGIQLSKHAESLYSNGLDRIIISFHSFNESIFRQMTGGNFEDLNMTLKGIDKALSFNFKDIRLNFVMNNEISRIDDLQKTLSFAKSRNIKVMIVPLFDYNLKSSDSIYSFDKLYQLIKDLFGIQHEEIIIDNEGFRKREITTNSDEKILLKLDNLSDKSTFKACSNCLQKNECREGNLPLRLSAKGILCPCLAHGIPEIDIYSLIKNRNEQEVENIIHEINEL